MNVKLLVKILFVNLFTFLVFNEFGLASDKFQIVVIGKTVSILDFDGNERDIYTTEKDYIDEYQLKMSPDSSLLAIVEWTRGKTSQDMRYYDVLPSSNLVVCEMRGKVIFQKEDVKRFSWSPNSKKIAFISGIYDEDGGGFNADGVYILDLNYGEIKIISRDFEYNPVDDYDCIGFDLNWSMHDSNLYIQDFDFCAGVYIYDVSLDKTVKSSHKGIYFSPDGKYYLSLISEGSPQIYITATDEDITDIVKKDAGSIPYSFLPGYNHHLKTAKEKLIPKDGYHLRKNEIKIYDLDQRQVIESWLE